MGSHEQAGKMFTANQVAHCSTAAAYCARDIPSWSRCMVLVPYSCILNGLLLSQLSMEVLGVRLCILDVRGAVYVHPG